MIRHTVLISFDGADDSLLDSLIPELRALPALIPEIADYTVGRDLGLDDAAPTIVVIGDFESVDDYRTYATHPEHLRVVQELIRPHATGISRAQIELP